MAYADLTTLDGLLKDMYVPRLRNQIYKDTPAYKRIQRQSEKSAFDGREAKIAARYQRSQAVGARAEGAALPTAQNMGTRQMTVTVSSIYGKIKLSGQAIRSTRTGGGAFARALDDEMEGIMESLSYDLARQLVHGDGTGKLAQANGAGASTTTLTVNNPGTQHLYAGAVIDIYTAGGTQEVNSVAIVSVDSSTQVTLASAQTWSDDSFIYREDARNEEAMGLAGICDDGSRVSTFQGLSRSSNTWLNANVLTNSGVNRAMTKRLVDDLCLEATKNGGGGYPSALYSRHVHVQNYADLITPDRRYSPKEDTLDGGYKAVQVTHPGGTCHWIADRMVRANEVWAVNEKDLILFEREPLGWWSEDGTILHRGLDGSDSVEAVLITELTLGAQCCNRSSVLEDLSE